MKIFLAGATGAVGRIVLNQLVDSGFEALAATRSESKANDLRKWGLHAVQLDVLDRAAVRNVILQQRPDVIIDLLSSLPQVYTPESMKKAGPEDAKVRIEGGANLQSAALEAGVQKYIVQSCCYFYQQGPGSADENTPFAFQGPPFISSRCRMFEAIEKRVFEDEHLSGISLRYGFFYGPGTWFHPEGDLGEQVRHQRFKIIGEGRGVWNFVHVEDAAQATIDAIHAPKGIYNITNSQPVELRIWLPAFARWICARSPIYVPADDPSADENAVYYANSLRGATNEKAKRMLKFKPRVLEWLEDDSRQIELS